MQTIPIPLEYQKFIDEKIWLLEEAGCISESLSPWAAPVKLVPQNIRPLNPQEQQLCLVLDYLVTHQVNQCSTQ